MKDYQEFINDHIFFCLTKFWQVAFSLLLTFIVMDIIWESWKKVKGKIFKS